jgi:hypothetical protein
VEKANLDRDYLNYDFAKYFNQGLKNAKKKDEEVVSSPKYDDASKDERIKDRTELFEKAAKDEFDVDKYDGFELVKDGRYGDTAWLQYKEKFTSKR